MMESLPEVIDTTFTTSNILIQELPVDAVHNMEMYAAFNTVSK